MMLNVKVDGDSLVGETAGCVNPLLAKEDYRRGQLYAILCPCKRRKDHKQDSTLQRILSSSQVRLYPSYLEEED